MRLGDFEIQNNGASSTLTYIGNNTDYWTSSNIGMTECSLTKNSTTDMINDIVKKPEVSPDTHTKLDVKNGNIYARYFKDGFFTNEKRIISDIKDVTQYDNVIIVTFADGAKTKAVLDDEDYYSLEQGISVCITKKLLGEEGSALYNKLINRALKVIKRNEVAARKAEEKKLENKRCKEAAAARKARKKLKKREEQIEIQKEAYLRAMQAFNKGEYKNRNNKKKFGNLLTNKK